jgi:hypothetical protein
VIGVFVGDSVIVGEGTGVSVAVEVMVGVSEGELPLKVGGLVTSIDTLKRTVRELVAVIVRWIKGTSFGTMGINSSETVTRMR